MVLTVRALRLAYPLRQIQMAIIDSADGKTLTKYSIDELKEQAALMRGYSLTALCAAGSGHAGGTLSIMDVAAALYLRCHAEYWSTSSEPFHALRHFVPVPPP